MSLSRNFVSWAKFRLVFSQFSISSWSEKGHEPSRAEPSWKFFSLSYGSIQLGSDSSLSYIMRKRKPKKEIMNRNIRGRSLTTFWPFFDHLPPYIDIFYCINVDKKWTFLDHPPTLSCKRSFVNNPLYHNITLNVRRAVQSLWNYFEVMFYSFSKMGSKYLWSRIEIM